MHEVLVNRLGGLSLPRKSVVRLTDRPDMTLDVYRGRKTTMQLIFELSLLPRLIWSPDLITMKILKTGTPKNDYHNSSKNGIICFFVQKMQVERQTV